MSNGFKIAALPKTLGTLCLLLLVSLSGCSRNYSRFMKLPADPGLESGIGWVVISSAYAPLREKPGRSAAELTVVRGGTVFKPAARVIDAAGKDEGGSWYEYREDRTRGWIHSGDAILFSSAEQARHYVSGLRDK